MSFWRFTRTAASRLACAGFSAAVAVALLAGLPGFSGGSAALHAQEKENEAAGQPGGADIEWTPVPGAREYQFEVRDGSKASVLRRTVRQPKIRLRLPEGRYEMRSRAVDRFRRQTPWSTWAPLRIRYAIPAVVRNVSPESLPVDSSSREIEVRGQNFLPDTQVRLTVAGRELQGDDLRVEYVNPRTLRVRLADGAPRLAGKYDLTLINPGNMQTRKTAAFKLEAKTEPDATPDPRPVVAVQGEQGPNREGGRSQLPAEMTDPGFSFLALIPGLPDFVNGRYVRGTLWFGTFVGVTATAAGGFVDAASAASTASSSALYPSFSNPTYLLALNSLSGQDQLSYIFNTTQVQANVQSSYSSGRDRYLAFGGAAVLTYFAHLALYAFAGPDLPVYDPDAGTSGVSLELRPVPVADDARSVRGRSVNARNPANRVDLRMGWTILF